MAISRDILPHCQNTRLGRITLIPAADLAQETRGLSQATPLLLCFGKGRALQGTVFQPHHPPVEGGKDRLDPRPKPFPHHPVKRLAVIVDHPRDIAQIVLPALLQRHVDIALDQLTI